MVDITYVFWCMHQIALPASSQSENNKMVQDCVFAGRSEFQFGVRRKNRYNPGSAGSEFGERPVPFFELRTLAGSEFGVRTGPNHGSAGMEFGERPVPFPGPTLVWQVRSLEKGPGQKLVGQVRSSEKDRLQRKEKNIKKNKKIRKKIKKGEKKEEKK